MPLHQQTHALAVLFVLGTTQNTKTMDSATKTNSGAVEQALLSDDLASPDSDDVTSGELLSAAKDAKAHSFRERRLTYTRHHILSDSAAAAVAELLAEGGDDFSSDEEEEEKGEEEGGVGGGSSERPSSSAVIKEKPTLSEATASEEGEQHEEQHRPTEG